MISLAAFKRAKDSSRPRTAVISKGPGEAFLPESAARSGQSSAPLSGENSEEALRNECSISFFVTKSPEKQESTSIDLLSEASISASVMVFQRSNSIGAAGLLK